MHNPIASPSGLTCDVLVIGGGVNGAGIARDAAGRGLKVILVEQADLASATSSASSKLIHGGLRYLEYYEFRLVREALAERDVLLRAAPHIIWPLQFVLPHAGEVRPAWMIRAGLMLYDRLGWTPGRRSALRRSQALRFAATHLGAGLRNDIARGFAYWDCWVDDARLVVLNARDAAARGADIRVRTRVASLRRGADSWQAELIDHAGARSAVTARLIVNAAGPWADRVLAMAQIGARQAQLRLVKGSHIIVPRQYDGAHAFILQNDDRRIVFVIPYEERFTLIGTTDLGFEGEPAGIKITSEETDYLCRAASRWLAKPITPADVVWSYAGVRPLHDDGSHNAAAVTRDYVFDVQASGGAPMLSVFGGKITTYRRLAEHALAKITPFFPRSGPPWTAGATLPGGDLGGGFDSFVAKRKAAFPTLDPDLVQALARRYGSQTDVVLDGVRGPHDLGRDFGAHLTEREVDFLVRAEWARGADDILWRRTKCGLHMDDAQREAVASHLISRHGLN
jgi:glycerol-3-phosphate dehydrogenase